MRAGWSLACWFRAHNRVVFCMVQFHMILFMAFHCPASVYESSCVALSLHGALWTGLHCISWASLQFYRALRARSVCFMLFVRTNVFFTV